MLKWFHLGLLRSAPAHLKMLHPNPESCLPEVMHHNHGASRSRLHPPPTELRLNTMRSCSRDWRPCQNSTISGTCQAPIQTFSRRNQRMAAVMPQNVRIRNCRSAIVRLGTENTEECGARTSLKPPQCGGRGTSLVSSR